jgi:hypothetical protein
MAGKALASRLIRKSGDRPLEPLRRLLREARSVRHGPFQHPYPSQRVGIFLLPTKPSLLSITGPSSRTTPAVTHGVHSVVAYGTLPWRALIVGDPYVRDMASRALPPVASGGKIAAAIRGGRSINREYAGGMAPDCTVVLLSHHGCWRQAFYGAARLTTDWCMATWIREEG